METTDVKVDKLDGLSLYLIGDSQVGRMGYFVDPDPEDSLKPIVKNWNEIFWSALKSSTFKQWYDKDFDEISDDILAASRKFPLVVSTVLGSVETGVDHEESAGFTKPAPDLREFESYVERYIRPV